MPPLPDSQSPAVAARGLVKTFGALRAVDGIDLKVPRFIREEADFPGAYPPHDWVHEVHEEGKIRKD